MNTWNPSQTEREWIAVCATMGAVLFLGLFDKTAPLAKGFGVVCIVILLLNANAVTRLQTFVTSIGGPTL